MDPLATLGCLDPALHIVLLTARPRRVQPQTLGWLERNGLRWDVLIMRDHGDYDWAREFKERTVDELMSDKTEEAAFVASRSAAQAEKDVSLETVTPSVVAEATTGCFTIFENFVAGT